MPKLLSDDYVPGLSQNLGGGKLMASGYSIIFYDGTCVLIEKHYATVTANIPMSQNKLFPLVVSNIEKHALTVKEDNESRLWHLRY